MALSCGFCLGESSSEYTSAQFSEAFQSVIGNGICAYGGRFAVKAADALTVNVDTGFALVGGRWFYSDAVEAKTVSPPDNHFDRYDAVVISVDLVSRASSLKLITGTPGAFPKKYVPVRDDSKLELVLAYILVKMGATHVSQDNIEDTHADLSLCGNILNMSKAAGSILKVYNFFGSGIDLEVDRLKAVSVRMLQKGDEAVQAITQAMISANVGRAVGELAIRFDPPTPAEEWLLCDGRSVPASYPMLDRVLNGTLPKITPMDARFRAYIYGGTPVKKSK